MSLDPVHQGVLIVFGNRHQPGCHRWTGRGCTGHWKSGPVLVDEEEKGKPCLQHCSIGLQLRACGRDEISPIWKSLPNERGKQNQLVFNCLSQVPHNFLRVQVLGDPTKGHNNLHTVLLLFLDLDRRFPSDKLVRITKRLQRLPVRFSCILMSLGKTIPSPIDRAFPPTILNLQTSYPSNISRQAGRMIFYFTL